MTLKQSYAEVQGKEIVNLCACSTSFVFHKITREEAWQTKKLLAIIRLKYSREPIHVYQSHICWSCHYPTLHILSEELKLIGAEMFLKRMREATGKRDLDSAEFWESLFKFFYEGKSEGS